MDTDIEMKITRRQLIKLIAEALDEGKRIIVDPEGEAFIASDAYQTGAAKDVQSFGYSRKLDKMKKSQSKPQRRPRTPAKPKSKKNQNKQLLHPSGGKGSRGRRRQSLSLIHI